MNRLLVELILKIRGGNRVALNDLAVLLEPVVRRQVCSLHRGQDQDIDDLVQTVLVEVCRSMDRVESLKFESDGFFLAFVYRIAERAVLSYREQTARRESMFRLTDPADLSFPAPQANDVRDWHIALLYESLEELSPEDRKLIKDRHLDAVTSSEVERDTGVNAGTVRARLQTALFRLRAVFDRMLSEAEGRRLGGPPIPPV